MAIIFLTLVQSTLSLYLYDIRRDEALSRLFDRVSLALFGGNAYAKTHIAADVLRLDAWPSIDLFAIIHGLIILVIAEVFRAGARLEEDQSLTI